MFFTAANNATILNSKPLFPRQSVNSFGIFCFPAALQTLWGPGEYREEMNEMLVEQAAIEASPPKSPLQLLRDETVRWQLLTLSIIYFCNQMSGMSAVSVGKKTFNQTRCVSLRESRLASLPS